MGQNRKERESRAAGLTPARPAAVQPGAARAAAGTSPAGLPREFRAEVRTALRYERGLAVKALVALAVVVAMVLIRMLLLG